MIELYSGTPGSGKSLHLARRILDELKFGRKVICNFDINLPKRMRKRSGNFFYYDNSEINPQMLYEFSMQHNKPGREGQTLLVIDECAIMFNSRDYARKDRMPWIQFFQQHRKLGYNIILVAQNDRLIDRQIRSFIENEVKHRKVNNFGSVGFLMSLIGVKLFVAVSVWYGLKEKLSSEFFMYRRKYSRIYDTSLVFAEQVERLKVDGSDGSVPDGVAGGDPRERARGTHRHSRKECSTELVNGKVEICVSRKQILPDIDNSTQPIGDSEKIEQEG